MNKFQFTSNNLKTVYVKPRCKASTSPPVVSVKFDHVNRCSNCQVDFVVVVELSHCTHSKVPFRYANKSWQARRCHQPSALLLGPGQADTFIVRLGTWFGWLIDSRTLTRERGLTLSYWHRHEPGQNTRSSYNRFRQPLDLPENTPSWSVTFLQSICKT